MKDIDNKFSQIKEAYSQFEQHLRDAGKGLVYRTAKGIYGTTGLENIFDFFREVQLQNCSHFLDLGSGDGRVVMVASLFTEATGIESDPGLVSAAVSIRDELGLDCELIKGDYLEHDLTQYDIIFINPDHEFDELDVKLKDGLKGPLFVCNEIFAPELLRKGKKYWYRQVPIIKYTAE